MNCLLSLLGVSLLASLALAKPPEPNIAGLIKQLEGGDPVKAVAAARR